MEKDTTAGKSTKDLILTPVIEQATSTPTGTKGVEGETDNSTANKRRCVSTACIACRRRKSKCDGNLPKCAACASVYLTECEYAPHTDHRRKGVYKKDVDSLKSKNTTLQTLIHALLNYDEDEAFDLVRQIRSCNNLESLAQAVEKKERGLDVEPLDSPVYGNGDAIVPRFEAELSSRMGDLVIDGAVRFIGGTSNLIWLDENEVYSPKSPASLDESRLKPREEAILSWTNVTRDKDTILHFMNMYFCWHYTFFTTLSKELFYRDFLTGVRSQFCSPLLVNIMLALGCHFSSRSDARADPTESGTTGDHYFAEAERHLQDNEEFAIPKLCTVQALALMSVREVGCGRESKGWVYSGMSFRMASDLGLNVDVEPITAASKLSDEEMDARRITFWGCFFFDKCWSNYLGRQPQLLLSSKSVKKPDVFASEEAVLWSPYTDDGIVRVHSQPARTRAVSLQIFKLAEISSDLLAAFYQPHNSEKPVAKQTELKKLSDIHTRLEAWKQELPTEFDTRDGQLPHILIMHMFYQLLYIHLYRPFLKYTKTTSPLPAHISPRKFCTQAAGAISKLFRLYKRTHGLRQICNIAVYIAHSACTIHLLNLPDKNAKRDIVHGVKQLEEIGESWTCAKRTLRILGICADKWNIELPEEVQAIFAKAHHSWSQPSPGGMSPAMFTNAPYRTHPQVNGENVVPNLQPFTSNQPMLASDPRADLSTSAAVDGTSFSNSIQTTMHMQHPHEPIRNSTRSKTLTQLTEAQQEAWNAHQSRMAAMVGSSSADIIKCPPKNAAALFGGVESLLEESQNWWLQEQSQLAVEFDNWNASTTDWSPVGAGMVMPPHSDNAISAAPHSARYYSDEVVQPEFSNLASSNHGTGIYSPTHNLQQQQELERQLLMSNLDHAPPASRVPSDSRKRTMDFEDSRIFY